MSDLQDYGIWPDGPEADWEEPIKKNPYITIELTEDQLETIIVVLNEACLDNARDEHFYPFLHRIRVSLNKQLAKAKTV